MKPRYLQFVSMSMVFAKESWRLLNPIFRQHNIILLPIEPRTRNGLRQTTVPASPLLALKASSIV